MLNMIIAYCYLKYHSKKKNKKKKGYTPPKAVTSSLISLLFPIHALPPCNHFLNLQSLIQYAKICIKPFLDFSFSFQ